MYGWWLFYGRVVKLKRIGQGWRFFDLLISYNLLYYWFHSSLIFIWSAALSNWYRLNFGICWSVVPWALYFLEAELSCLLLVQILCSVCWLWLVWHWWLPNGCLSIILTISSWACLLRWPESQWYLYQQCDKGSDVVSVHFLMICLLPLLILCYLIFRGLAFWWLSVHWKAVLVVCVLSHQPSVCNVIISSSGLFSVSFFVVDLSIWGQEICAPTKSKVQ